MATLLEVPGTTSMSRLDYSNGGSNDTQHDDSDADGLSLNVSPVPLRSHVDISTQATDPRSDDTEEEIRPRKERRIKGRRRAINPLPHVEAALRRQQELKTNFRTLARPLKLILREMARRSVEDMESNPLAHEEAVDGEIVRDRLQRRLDDRKSHVDTASQLQSAHLERTHVAEAEVCRRHCLARIEALQEQALHTIEQDIIAMHKALRFEHDRASQETDIEVDTSALMSQQKPDDHRYDSHLRHVVSTTKAGGALDGRARMRSLLQTEGFLDERDITVMDPTHRELAEARKDAKQTLDLLLVAGTQVENNARERNMALLTQNNSDVSALLALADMAIDVPHKRTSRSSKMPPPSTPARRVHPEKIEGSDDDTSARSSTKRHMRHDSNPTHIKRMRKTSDAKPDIAAITAVDGMAQNSKIKDERQSVSPRPRPDDTMGRSRTLSLPMQPSHETGRPDGLAAHNGGFGRQIERSLLYRPSGEEQYTPLQSFGRRYEHERPPSSSRSDGMHSLDRLFSRYQQTDREPLAPSFFHRPSIAGEQSGPPPGPGFDSFRFRTIDFNPMETRPPLPPTAQPVNHFGRSGLSSLLPPMPPPLQSIPSPLVALPQSRAPQTHPPFSFYPPPPPPPAPYRASQGHMPQLQPLLPGGQQSLQPRTSQSQYGGPMLAPAAGLSRAAQPVFAQQMDRQEQSRRRNTDSGFPKFRPYHGPNQS